MSEKEKLVHERWCGEMVKKANAPHRYATKTVKANWNGIVTSGHSKGYLARQIAALL